MIRPQPKADLIVERENTQYGPRFKLTWHTEKAREFIVDATNKFCMGTCSFTDKTDRDVYFYPYSGYDLDEIEAWLNAFNHQCTVTVGGVELTGLEYSGCDWGTVTHIGIVDTYEDIRVTLHGDDLESVETVYVTPECTKISDVPTPVVVELRVELEGGNLVYSKTFRNLRV